MKDRIGNEVKEGDFILYVTKSEAPSIQFAWVEEIVEEPRTNYRGEPAGVKYRMKIHHAKSDGTRKTKAVWSLGEYDPISDNYPNAGYRDTGKPSTVWLNGYGEEDHRLLVTKPY